jgi:hypothetical protein
MPVPPSVTATEYLETIQEVVDLHILIPSYTIAIAIMARWLIKWQQLQMKGHG